MYMFMLTFTSGNVRRDLYCLIQSFKLPFPKPNSFLTLTIVRPSLTTNSTHFLLNISSYGFAFETPLHIE